MPEFDEIRVLTAIAHIVTAPIQTYAEYQTMRTFMTGEVYNKRLEIFSYCLLCLIPMLLILFGNPFQFLAFSHIGLMIFISFNYDETIPKRILYSICAYCIGFVIEIIVAYTINVRGDYLLDESDITWLFVIFFSRLIHLSVTYLMKKYLVVVKNDFSVPLAYYMAFIVILLGTCYLFIQSFHGRDDVTFPQVLIGGAVLLVVNGLFMFVDEKIYKTLQLTAEKKVLELQNESYLNQGTISTEANSTIKTLKHDMTSHIHVLRELHKNGQDLEFEGYVAKILGDVNNEKICSSNHFIFDSIINLKLQPIRESDVSLTLDVSVPEVLNMLAYDITVIVGNLIDNAVTGTLASKEKKLSISITYAMGNLVILIDNSYSGQLKIKDGGLLTTKKDKTSHGLGLKNVERSVSRYDGELRIDHSENSFSISVVIPC